MDLSEYVNALRPLSPGDAAELNLSGLSSRAGKRRLGQAAGQLGYRVKWSRATTVDALFFQILPGKGSARPANGRPRRRGSASAAEARTQARSARSVAGKQPARRGRRKGGSSAAA
jgi:hypothetical protein